MPNSPVQEAIATIFLETNQPITVGDLLDRLPAEMARKAALDELDRLVDQGLVSRQDTLGDVSLVVPTRPYLQQQEALRHKALEEKTRSLPEEERAAALDQDPDYMLEQMEDNARNQHDKPTARPRQESTRVQAETKGELSRDQEAALLASRHARHDHKKT